MVMFNAPSDQVVGETATGPIHGWVKAGYEPVLAAFADNFEHRGEVFRQAVMALKEGEAA